MGVNKGGRTFFVYTDTDTATMQKRPHQIVTKLKNNTYKKTERVNWTLPGTTLKLLDQLCIQYYNSSPNTTMPSYGKILTLLIKKQMNPTQQIKIIREEKKELAKKMTLLTEKETDLIERFNLVEEDIKVW